MISIMFEQLQQRIGGEACRHIRVETGERVFRQGDRTFYFFRIETGAVRLERTLADGSSVTIHTASDGETFAEASLFADHYHCDAVCERNAVIAAMPKASIREALLQDPLLALEAMKFFAGQVRDVRTNLEIRNIRSAADRLLAWLRTQAQGSPPTVEIRFPWKSVASQLGLSAEATYRALADLQRRNLLIRIDRAHVSLT